MDKISRGRIELIKSLKSCPFHCKGCNREVWVSDIERIVPMTEHGNLEIAYAIKCQKNSMIRTEKFPTLSEAVDSWNNRVTGEEKN